VEHATAAEVARTVAEGEHGPAVPPYTTLDESLAKGGYELLRACRDGRRDRDELVAILETADLRGLGGAGFRSAQKWKLVRQQPLPRLMALNADEGEPGTFKDRYYLEREPHQVLEGM